ncbi:hypothetical protein [Ekhidna sp.]|uniref:hypothetical protein n=1 Tax=Ekhidna sp. TaxID=2608089 RepID=UPI003C79CD3C
MGQSVDGVPVMLEYTIEDDNYKIEGTPFLFETWEKIQFKRDNGAYFEAPSGNYHLYLNELIVNLDGKYRRLHECRQIDWFQRDDRKFIRIKNEEKDGWQFGELLVDTEKIQLLKLYHCFIQKGKPNQGIIEATPDKYVHHQKYVVRKADNPEIATELKVKKKGGKLKEEEKFPEFVKFLKKYKSENLKEEENLKNVISKF